MAMDDDDSSIEICSPPPAKKHHSDEPAETNNDGDDDDDGALVVSSTLVNPNIDYPHGRINCGKFRFSVETAQQHCPKCYCHVCDIPAKDCPSWSLHCSAKPIVKDTSVSTDEVTVLSPAGSAAAMSAGLAAFLRNRTNNMTGRNPRRRQRWMMEQDDDDYYYDYGEDEQGIWGAPALLRKDRAMASRATQNVVGSKRITDVLAEKLSLMVKVTETKSERDQEEILNHIFKSEDNGVSPWMSLSPWMTRSIIGETEPLAGNLKMEGDVAQLRLHNSFFVEGIRIGWPFSTILTPQRQMAIHIVKALKRKLHVVLESPTGTGKSAAILCSVLAWQRYQAKVNLAKKQQRLAQAAEAIVPECDDEIDKLIQKVAGAGDESNEEEDQRDAGERVEPDVPTIVYCSRTHSQVAQMVASLRKTPYRPRMTVLGSRDRLCINRELVGKNVNLNQQCRDRKMATDKKRRDIHKSKTGKYDDDNPEPFVSGGKETADEVEIVDDEMDGNADQNADTPANDTKRRGKPKPTCPHYQQLTTLRTARAVKDRFFKTADHINNCCEGGEETTLGVMDIEDLVEFGKNPYRESRIAVYRQEAKGSFGMSLGRREEGGCRVVSLTPDGPVAKDGRVKPGDWIQSINGVSVKSWSLADVKQRIVSLAHDPLILTVQRDNAPVSEESEDDVEYSDHAVCPYYLSRALMSSADLIFARKCWSSSNH